MFYSLLKENPKRVNIWQNAEKKKLTPKGAEAFTTAGQRPLCTWRALKFLLAGAIQFGEESLNRLVKLWSRRRVCNYCMNPTDKQPTTCSSFQSCTQFHIKSITRWVKQRLSPLLKLVCEIKVRHSGQGVFLGLPLAIVRRHGSQKQWPQGWQMYGQM